MNKVLIGLIYLCFLSVFSISVASDYWQRRCWSDIELAEHKCSALKRSVKDYNENPTSSNLAWYKIRFKQFDQAANMCLNSCQRAWDRMGELECRLIVADCVGAIKRPTTSP